MPGRTKTCRTELPIDMSGRKFRVGQECGEVFEDDVDFDGITVTIELKDPDEARAVLTALLRQSS